jgi:YVTN family beta-propeller protein
VPLGAVAVGARPWGLALSPDGSHLYTANGPSNDVSVVDTATLTLITKVPVGQSPWGVAIVER